MKMPTRRALPLLVLIGSACAQGTSPPASALPEWTVGAEPLAVIGARGDPRESHSLTKVVGATRTSAGVIAVASQGSSDVRLFDATGRHIRSTGGSGRGPGEFVHVMEIRRGPGDTLLVLALLPAVTRITPEGDYEASEGISLPEPEAIPCRIAEGGWHLLPHGGLLRVALDNFGIPGCPPAPPDAWRMSALVTLHDLDQSVGDTVAVMPAMERNGNDFRVYGGELLVAAGTNRLLLADSRADEILEFDATGSKVREHPMPFPEVSVPRAARREKYRVRALPNGSTQRQGRYSYPDVYPRAGRLLLAETGELWVMAYPGARTPLHSWRLTRPPSWIVEEGGARWRILAQDGQAVAEVRTPPDFFVLEVGADYLLGVKRDELDVEAVEIYSLSRS